MFQRCSCTAAAAALLLITTLFSSPTHGFVVSPPNAFVRTQRPTFESSCATSITTSIRQPSSRFLFGGLFGDDKDKKKDGELALCPVPNSSPADFGSLSEYIRQWSGLLEGDSSLTTPVKVEAAKVPSKESGIDASSGVQILFQPRKSSYKSKKEEDEAEQGGSGDQKNEPKKEGGIQVLVEQLENGELQVRATRCNMDEDTMIKEMSEDAIVDKLKGAVLIWSKDRE